MTEQEWLDCVDSREMLDYLHNKPDRRTYLFALACVRQLCGYLNQRGRNILNRIERKDFDLSPIKTEPVKLVTVKRGNPLVQAVLQRMLLHGFSVDARFIAERTAYAIALIQQDRGDNLAMRLERVLEKQCHLLRDIVNPVKPVFVRNHEWRTPTVVQLAKVAYREYKNDGTLDPVNLSVLADALEDVGAACVYIDHLRSPGPHVRGCWVLDIFKGVGYDTY